VPIKILLNSSEVLSQSFWITANKSRATWLFAVSWSVATTLTHLIPCLGCLERICPTPIGLSTMRSPMTPLIPASTFVWKTISVSQENGGTSLAQSLELQSTFARRNKMKHLWAGQIFHLLLRKSKRHTEDYFIQENNHSKSRVYCVCYKFCSSM